MLTRLGEAGVDAFTIMRIAGHSTITISQRYVHPSAEAIESAFEKLEAANKPTGGRRGHMAGTPRNRRRANSSQVVEIKSALA